MSTDNGAHSLACTNAAETLKAIEIFATSPSSLGSDTSTYLANAATVAQWAERAGCAGILIYTDNSILDPWLVAQVIIRATNHLCPLVAVQPVYMHPYSVAKMVTSLAFLHHRRVYLNMVAGGFKNDLAALDDRTPHDKRYARLVEYTAIIKSLLADSGPVSYDGEFYKVDKLALKPPLPAGLFPGIFVSGSSDAGIAAARVLGATAVKYPEPPSECASQPSGDPLSCGVRVGIIAREDHEAAWEIAHARFPEDRRGRITHELAMKVSDSFWHRKLSHLGEAANEVHNPYWLVPFELSKTNCPYLVGSYDEVSEPLAAYISAGYKSFILDIPPAEEDLHHTGIVFERALKRAAI